MLFYSRINISYWITLLVWVIE